MEAKLSSSVQCALAQGTALLLFFRIMQVEYELLHVVKVSQDRTWKKNGLQ